jgi:hypothetical protein
MNPNSILFLYEGETEKEFYEKIFDIYLPKRKIKIIKSNLYGVHNINKKVRNKILRFLDDKKDQDQIHVLVAYDREGTRNVPSNLNPDILKKKFVSHKNSRIASINEVIATQDLESWLFNDIEGIYNFLRIPKTERKVNRFNNIEATNNRTLSKLFHRYNKHYQKGRRIEGFLNHLNIEKIYNCTPQLKKMMKLITSLCE